MAHLVTLSDLIQRVRDRGEISSAYLSDTQLTAMINAGIAELWRFINSIDRDWLMSDDPQTVAIVAGTSSYPLAADHFLCRGVDLLDSSGRYRNLQRYGHGERNRRQGCDLSWTAYRIAGSQLRLIPAPQSSGTARIWYVPTQPILASTSTTGNATAGSTGLTSVASLTGISVGHSIYVAGEPCTFRVRAKGSSTITLDKAVSTSGTGVAISRDTIDLIAGFDEYPLLSALLKYCALEETDPSVYMAEFADLKSQITAVVSDRDVGEPDRIRDVRREQYEDLVPTWDRP